VQMSLIVMIKRTVRSDLDANHLLKLYVIENAIFDTIGTEQVVCQR
jgi:hypothetical protein